MGKPPEKKPDHAKPPAFCVLPMKLQLGDRLSDERAEWQVIGRPYTTAGGKSANVRVKRVGSEVTMIRVWGAHERVAVKRAGGAS